MQHLNLQSGVPSAHVTVNRNRLKNYGNKVYLKHGTNFEIELFNPLTKRVLVKIEIDGMAISSTGLILNPGQRAYLERWIDNDRKFLFSTYEIENSPEAKAAIANNGRVKISFYEEQNKSFIVSYNPNPNWWHCTPYYGGTSVPYVYGSSGNIVTTVNSPSTFTLGGGTTTNAFFCSTSGVRGSAGPNGDAGLELNDTASLDMSSVETGRTEMGEQSNQQFGTSFGDFNYWTVADIEWQILPESQKPVEISKLRQYCPGCRNRIRKETWKFCPSCGESLQ